jgi:hypothetical protein
MKLEHADSLNVDGAARLSAAAPRVAALPPENPEVSTS